jgi:hypothetical protein
VRIVPSGAPMQYRFHVHRTLPDWRLVIGDGRFPAATSEDQWTFTRARAAADTNPDVQDAVARDGYCLFRISARFSDLDADLARTRGPSADGQTDGN